MIIVFDGLCTLCDASVRFIIDHDPERHFRFASLQSEAAAQLLAERGFTQPAQASSVLLVRATDVLSGSTAALTIAGGLSAPWRFLGLALVVPRPVRDAVYAFIARNRYRWFGRREACRIPTADDRARFL